MNTGNELAVERYIDAPTDVVWQVMTVRIAEWFCPKPWTTEIIEQDWRAGGRSALVMHGPNGETSRGDGVFLEVTQGKRYVFTDAFAKGWVPQGPFMVGCFELTPERSGTLFRASARHWTEEAMKQHEAMGFVEGWTKVAGQLAELCEAAA